MLIDVGVKDTPEKEPVNMVYINDFGEGDKYNDYENEKEWNDLERAARKIRRRYRHIVEYNEAVIIFCEYMAKLSLSYGNRDLFNIALQSDAVEAFIPPFPRLKMTKKNKNLLKKGIIVDTRKYQTQLSEFDAENAIRNLMGTDEREYYDPDREYNVKNTGIHHCKQIKDYQIDANILGCESYSSSTSSNGARKSEVDYLEEYFRSKNILKDKKRKKKKGERDSETLSGADWYYGRYENEETSSGELRWYQGSMLTDDEIEDVKMLRTLKDNGWDSVKMMRKGGYNKTTGATFKHMRNIDKMEKKRAKKKKKNDDFLTKILTDNAYDSFDDFESDMLDLGADNILGGE